MKEHKKHWYLKDERFFKVLSIAGNSRQEDAVKIDISASRLKNMEKDKLIEKVTYPSRYNKNPIWIEERLKQCSQYDRQGTRWKKR